MFLNFIWYIWICEILFPPQDKKVIVSFFNLTFMTLFLTIQSLYLTILTLLLHFFREKVRIIPWQKQKTELRYVKTELWDQNNVTISLFFFSQFWEKSQNYFMMEKNTIQNCENSKGKKGRFVRCKLAIMRKKYMILNWERKVTITFYLFFSSLQ